MRKFVFYSMFTIILHKHFNGMVSFLKDPEQSSSLNRIILNKFVHPLYASGHVSIRNQSKRISKRILIKKTGSIERAFDLLT